MLLLASCSTHVEYDSIEKNEAFRASITKGDFVKLEAGYTYYNYSPGEGTPLVLVPSYSVPSYQWDHTTEMAIEKGLPVVSMDLYGRGNSSNPDTAYSVELFADQVIQLLDHLGITEKVNLSGVSMGGSVITQIAAHNPARINKLIFVAPQGFSYAFSEGVPEEDRAVTEEEIAEFIATDFPNRAEGQIEDFLNKDDFNWWIDLYRPLLNHKHFARALISTNKNARSASKENVMIGLYDFPVHCIWGTHDVVLPLEESRNNVLNWIPRAELHIVDSCGHMIQIEKTAEFDQIFFDEILN
jgi:pimeloyl-ACP methyl ester carboxylesterase